MAKETEKPNLAFIKAVLKERGMTTRQLSKLIYGDDTHRDIVREVATKPDIRASTLLKLCRALGISLDSLYQYSDTNSLKVPTISGIANVANSTNVKIDMADLKAENKALKMLIQEKDKRLEELQKDKIDLGKRLDMVLQIYQGKPSDI